MMGKKSTNKNNNKQLNINTAASTSENTAASTSENTAASTSENTAASTSENTAASTSENTAASTSENTAASTSESYITTFKQRYTIKDLLKKYNCNKSELKENLKYMLIEKIKDDNYTAIKLYVNYLKHILGYSNHRILRVFTNNPQCISTVKFILDGIKLAKFDYIEKKENYNKSIRENRENREKTIKDSIIANNDVTEAEKKEIIKNASNILNNKRYSEIIKQKLNNSDIYSFHNIAKLALMRTKSLIAVLNNKDIKLDSLKLRKIQQKLYTAKEYCYNKKLKKLLEFYHNCFYSVFLVVDELEAEKDLKESLEFLEKSLYKAA